MLLHDAAPATLAVVAPPCSSDIYYSQRVINKTRTNETVCGDETTVNNSLQREYGVEL